MELPRADVAGGEPRFLSSLQHVAVAARGAWSPGRLLIAWAAVLPIYLLTETASGWFLASLWSIVALAVVPAAASVIAAAAGWEYGRDSRWTVRQSVVLLQTRSLSLYASIASVVVVPACFLLPIVLGALVVGRIPGVGPFLSSLWLVLVGTPLGAIGAAFFVLALPATLLMVPASALDCPDVFDVVSRSISYVRTRPLEFGALLAAAAGSSLYAALVVAVAVFVFAALVVFAYQCGSAEEFLAVDDFARQLVSTADLGWPFRGASSVELEAAADLPILLTLLLKAVGRLVAASFFAGLVSALSRTYLYLRWALDREPPSALVRHDEEFRWDG